MLSVKSHGLRCLQSGVASLAWGPFGYQVMLAEVGATGQVLKVSLAKSLQASHRVAATRHTSSSYPNQEVHLLQVSPHIILMPCTESQFAKSQLSSLSTSPSFSQDSYQLQVHSSSCSFRT